MKTCQRLAVLLTVAALVGCHGSGFNRDALKERLNDGTFQSSDKAIAEARAAQPQLKLPCRVAVYFKPGDGDGGKWTPEDKASLEVWAEALKKEGFASEVIPLPDMLVGSRDKATEREVRTAAAKVGADVVLLIHGAVDTDDYKNPAAILNLTVVGGYLVPASHSDSLFVMEALLLDVDNGYVYTGVRAEGVARHMRPTFLIQARDSQNEARASAVKQFGEELIRVMRQVAVSPGVQR